MDDSDIRELIHLSVENGGISISPDVAEKVADILREYLDATGHDGEDEVLNGVEEVIEQFEAAVL